VSPGPAAWLLLWSSFLTAVAASRTPHEDSRHTDTSDLIRIKDSYRLQSRPVALIQNEVFRRMAEELGHD